MYCAMGRGGGGSSDFSPASLSGGVAGGSNKLRSAQEIYREILSSE